MLYRQGFTLMEMVVVLMIIAICTAVALPNFTNPTELAKASNAQNNLLAIYTAERNYNNAKGNYYLSPINVTDDTPGINSNLSLNIQPDGLYNYLCVTDPTGFVCTAKRNDGSNPANITLQVTNMPIQLNRLRGTLNPSCTPSPNNHNAANWCPLDVYVEK